MQLSSLRNKLWYQQYTASLDALFNSFLTAFFITYHPQTLCCVTHYRQKHLYERTCVRSQSKSLLRSSAATNNYFHYRLIRQKMLITVSPSDINGPKCLQFTEVGINVTDSLRAEPVSFKSGAKWSHFHIFLSTGFSALNWGQVHRKDGDSFFMWAKKESAAVAFSAAFWCFIISSVRVL